MLTDSSIREIEDVEVAAEVRRLLLLNEWDQLVGSLRKTYQLHTDEALVDEHRAYRWLMTDSVADDDYTAVVRARSWIHAADHVAAIQAEQNRRRRFGLANPAPDYGTDRDYLDRLMEAASLEHEIGCMSNYSVQGAISKGVVRFTMTAIHHS